MVGVLLEGGDGRNGDPTSGGAVIGITPRLTSAASRYYATVWGTTVCVCCGSSDRSVGPT